MQCIQLFDFFFDIIDYLKLSAFLHFQKNCFESVSHFEVPTGIEKDKHTQTQTHKHTQ